MIKELSVSYSDRKPQMDIFRPKVCGNGAAILFVHDGDRYDDKQQNVISYFCNRGFVCAAVSYRLSDTAAYPAQTEDLSEAMRFFKLQAERLHFDASRVAVIGFSAGGHLGMMLATESKSRETDPACVVVLCPVISRDKALQPSIEKLVQSGDETAYRMPPVLLIHGESDGANTFLQSKEFYHEYISHGNEAEIAILPGVEHGFDYGMTQECQKICLKIIENFLSRRRLENAPENLALGRNYFLSHPGLRAFGGDRDGIALTDGRIPEKARDDGWLTVCLSEETYPGKTFLGKDVVLPAWETGRPPHYSVTVDLGFVCRLDDVVVTFADNPDEGIVLPESVEVFLSDDGYNFTFFPCQRLVRCCGSGTESFVLVFDEAQSAKAVRLLVKTAVGLRNAIGEIAVHGVSKHATAMLAGQEENRWLYGVKTPDQKDERTGKSCCKLELALPAGRQNVSEIRLETKSDENSFGEPQYIAVYYSADGRDYSDFGTSALRSCYGRNENDCVSVFCVMRNHTVSAERIRILVYSDTPFQLHSLTVSGCEQPVEEPTYAHIKTNVDLAHTDICENRPLLVDAHETSILTNGIFTDDDNSVTKQAGETVIEADFGENIERINGIALFFSTDSPFELPAKIDTYLAAEGGSFSLVRGTETSHETAGKTIVRQLFGDSTARRIRVVIDSHTPYRLIHFSAYAIRPQLPLINGGFINPNFSPASANANSISYLDDYMWYIVLKGMKDLGMEYGILHYITNRKNMMTLIQEDEELSRLGYSSLHIQNSKDPLEAIFNAADRVGLKLFLGTAIGVGFSKVPNDAYHDEVIEAAKATITALYKRYGHRPSFFGYYLSDETCDQWLQQPGVIEKFRYIYGSQSDYIRSLHPGKKIMICPAIWRSGTPEDSGRCIYELVRGEKESDAPIVDIVAAQDCLGRADELILPLKMYRDFEKYLEVWAKSARAAGADYWNDVEVFSRNRVAKHIDDIFHSLQIESKYTGRNIVFDIVHYFCPPCQTGYIDTANRGQYSWRYARQDYHTMMYAKYYHQNYAEANGWGADLAEGAIL